MKISVEYRRFKFRWIAFPILLILAFLIWTTDRVTMQGERTIYTVNCVSGTWKDNRCSGQVSAGARIRYRALKAHRDVLFWEMGSPVPSSKLTDCTILDGRNWTCPVSKDASNSLTLELAKGMPISNSNWPTRPFHAVSKVTWLLLDFGFTPAQSWM